MSESPEKRGPGRPRSQSAKDAVLNAANELMRSIPVRDITIERIASEAGVGRPTIYRGWGNKCAVIMDAFFDSAAPDIRFPNAKRLSDALGIHVSRVIKLMRGPTGKTVSEMLGEGQSDSHILEEFRERFFVPLLAPARLAIEANIKAGELSKGHSPNLLLDLIYGPIYYRLLVGHLPLDDQFIKDLRGQISIILDKDTAS